MCQDSWHAKLNWSRESHASCNRKKRLSHYLFKMSATSVGERSAFAATATKNASWQQRQEQRAWFEALTAQTSSLPPSPFVNAPDIGGDNRTKFDSYVESLRGVLKKTQSDSKLSSPSSVSNPSMVAVLEARLGALLCADTFHMPQQQMAVCEREVVPFLREVLLELRPVRSHPGWCLLYASACNELATALVCWIVFFI